MNILPKKRWHVRTKENIARVKQDEAAYAEEQRQIRYRATLADQEARTELLRQKRTSASDNHELLSDRSVELIQGNKEYEAEKRAEQETKEKAIGLLTYLGQSVMESGGQKPWYEVHPKRLSAEKSTTKAKEEWDAKKKARADPLTDMNKVAEWFDRRREEKAKEEAKNLQRANSCIMAMPSLFPDDISVPKSSQTTKRSLNFASASKHRKYGSDSQAQEPPVHTSNATQEESRTDVTSGAVQMANQIHIDSLRAERLQRERRERERAALVMAKAMGLADASNEVDTGPVDERQLPFNSAFNPELAATLAKRRQNHREYTRRRHNPYD